MQPVTGALKLSIDQPAYTPTQLQPSHRRSLLASSDHAVSDWLDSNSQQHGQYVASSSGTDKHSSNPSSTQAEGTLVFTADVATGNASQANVSTNALILAGTSRWPNGYNATQMQLSVLVLFVVVVVASVVQVVVIGLWKLLQLKPEDLPK